jgi:hypothetical protein
MRSDVLLCWGPSVGHVSVGGFVRFVWGVIVTDAAPSMQAGRGGVIFVDGGWVKQMPRSSSQCEAVQIMSAGG